MKNEHPNTNTTQTNKKHKVGKSIDFDYLLKNKSQLKKWFENVTEQNKELPFYLHTIDDIYGKINIVKNYQTMQKENISFDFSVEVIDALCKHV